MLNADKDDGPGTLAECCAEHVCIFGKAWDFRVGAALCGLRLFSYPFLNSGSE
jgi:hypothetical protein